MATAGRMRKITIAVPAELVEFADAKASRDGASRSRVISECLAQARAREREALAAEGYRYCAEEACEFACASSAAVAECVGNAR